MQFSEKNCNNKNNKIDRHNNLIKYLKQNFRKNF